MTLRADQVFAANLTVAYVVTVSCILLLINFTFCNVKSNCSVKNLMVGLLAIGSENRDMFVIRH